MAARSDDRNAPRRNLGLSWADIDFDNARLSVRRSLVSSDYKIKVSEPKTERGRRTVALDPAMLRVLRDHQGRQLLERVAMAGDWGNELDLVFTRVDGSPIHPQAFSEMFEKHVKDSKLPKLSLHGLRHTHATIALRAGVHPKVVSERLGQASVAFTLDVYTDSLPDMQETAANLIAALVLDTQVCNRLAKRATESELTNSETPVLRGFLVAAGQGLEP
jgi:integrase